LGRVESSTENEIVDRGKACIKDRRGGFDKLVSNFVETRSGITFRSKGGADIVWCDGSSERRIFEVVLCARL